MEWWLINIIIVFLLGCLLGSSELVANYNESKYIFKVWQSFAYVLLNGIISVISLYILMHFKNEEITSLSKVEINYVIVSGLGGMMILRSSIFSIKHKGSKIDIGFGTIAQIFLDLIEKRMKNSAAALKIIEIDEIMKGVVFETTKDELSTLCIRSIDNFSEEDSASLLKDIEQISSLNISNTNKSIQLGISISQYCDNDLLKNSLKVLRSKEKPESIDGNSPQSINEIDFYLKKLKKTNNETE